MESFYFTGTVFFTLTGALVCWRLLAERRGNNFCSRCRFCMGRLNLDAKCMLLLRECSEENQNHNCKYFQIVPLSTESKPAK